MLFYRSQKVEYYGTVTTTYLLSLYELKIKIKHSVPILCLKGCHTQIWNNRRVNNSHLISCHYRAFRRWTYRLHGDCARHLCWCVFSLSALSPAAPAVIVNVQLWCESCPPAGRACWAATQTGRAKHPSKSLLDSANECGAQTIHPNPAAHLSATAVQEPEEVDYRRLSVCAPWPWKCG